MIVQKRQDLPDWASKRLVHWLNDAGKIEAAGKVALSKRRGGDPRPENEIVNAFLKGWALESVVVEWLRSLGLDVQQAPGGEKWYDLIVNGIKVDVKGNWKSISSYTQTKWERDVLAYNKDKVVYLCFEVDATADHFIIFDGAASCDKMCNSLSGNGTGFVKVSDLTDFCL